MKTKEKPTIIFVGKGSNPNLISFQKDVIRINDIDILQEDLELFINGKEIDFSKYTDKRSELLKRFNIWKIRCKRIANFEKTKLPKMTL